MYFEALTRGRGVIVAALALLPALGCSIGRSKNKCLWCEVIS